MNVVRVLLLSLFLFPAMGQLPSQDILALLEFKKGIKHDPTGYVLDSWNEESIDFNGCPSSWNGVVCNAGNVAAIVLNNLAITAQADLSVFSNLTLLVKLSMSNNSISGVIPDNIGELKNLEFLDLSENLFSSALPPGIGKLSSLRNLSLAGNNISGSVPDTVSGMSALQSLDLSRNYFSGSVPKSLTKLDNLVYLNLSSNGFTKSIPRGFELISGLKIVDLHDNMLEGHLDGEFFLLSTANYVDFSGNMLKSLSPVKVIPGLSETIKHLNLSHNRLEGSLESGSGLQLFENLKVMDLSYNQLSGELPAFSFVYDLEVLKLSNNNFSGFVPNNLLKGDSLLLKELDLSGNNLSGPISIIMSTSLRSLNLSCNSLTGELPLLTGNCVILDLSNNHFEGNLTRWVKWGDLEYIDLSRNNLTGLFPDVSLEFLRLNHLNLSHNILSGPLPKVTKQFPKVRVLDLSSNSLDGHLSTDLLSMPTLQELYLHDNLLTSTIELPSPSSIESNLRILDLSHNQLSGDFPNQFESVTKIQIIKLAVNNLSGCLPASMANLTSLTLLDVSQNHLTGPLPINFTTSLLSLNVSYNDLSGVVPENLRKFREASFYPGNDKLEFLPGSGNAGGESGKKRRINTAVKVVLLISCVMAVVILILLVIFIHYIRKSRTPSQRVVTSKDISKTDPSGVLTADEAGAFSEILSPDEKLAAVTTGYSPSKNSSHLSSSSPRSRDSFTTEHLARLDVRSPDQLVGELHFLDDDLTLTPEELSRAPAEVLGRSSHGTSYKATLENGVLLTVKWLREGVAKQRKEFAKEAKKFANIRHPNVVTLRGYYWGPTQHEKLILSDYISPGSLATFLYDRPGRKVTPLTWIQRLKIAVDIARGLNYLHFDRAVPHGNLKATNIVLDGADLNARVGDYSLHRLMTQAGFLEQMLDSGILGYRAPELAVSRKPLPSFKADVYAFGVILLELITGKCAGDMISDEQEGLDLTEWVKSKNGGLETFDSVLVEEAKTEPATEKCMKEVLGIALRCIRSVSERPGIKTIYEDLSSL